MCGRYYIDTNWLDEIGNVVYSFDIDWKICTEQFQGDILPTNTAPIIEKTEHGLQLSLCKWGFPLQKGKNLVINGNGMVTIGDNCDLGPEITFQTGGHEIGLSERRAGNGKCYSQYVGNGVWIGGRSTVLGNTRIGDGSVIAGCACVVKDIPENTLAGGVPAKMIRRLEA